MTEEEVPEVKELTDEEYAKTYSDKGTEPESIPEDVLDAAVKAAETMGAQDNAE